jgi:hypothetical protein
MKKATIGPSVLVVTLLASAVALGDSRYTDPAGDSGTAPDITAVGVAHDASGNLTFAVTTNQPTLPTGHVLTIYFDADESSSTGGDGIQFLLTVGESGWEFDRWDGMEYVDAAAPSASAVFSNGVLTFKLNKSDLGRANTFVFYVTSYQYDEDGEVVASDDAPNGTAVYEYTLIAPLPAPKPLTLRASAPVAVPAAPVHAKAFAVRVGVTRSDTGTTLANGVVTCKATVAFKPLRAAGSIRAGKAGCAMIIPKAAKGKRLRGTIKVTFRNVSVTKWFSYLIR